MATTNNLVIPLVEQSQAQKEVTVNAALMRIDALMNTGAKSRTTAAPPSTPASGDVYIVAASPTGDWAGHAGHITYFDQVWRFIIPQEGMSLWVNNEDVFYTFDGAAWVKTYNPTEFANLAKLGVNATADATNKFSVSSDAILLNHNGHGIQAKLNKNTSGETASFLYQTGFSGRAEFGTVGDDNFTLKVSPDGSTWFDALKIIAATGRMALKSIATGISAAGSAQGDATALSKSINHIATVSSGQGVRLSAPEAGELLLIANQGANAVNVYPASSHSINALAANTAISVAADSRKLFFATTSTNWYAL
ncbi:MAG: DUF2793 domain-containing protein [Alphaproteobacteria bacterium]|nr:DUF2793 domain-containing protein [Alphaproteobacteria bacterium]